MNRNLRRFGLPGGSRNTRNTPPSSPPATGSSSGQSSNSAQLPVPDHSDVDAFAESEYSEKAKLLIALANDLNALGGAQFKLDIPCLAFIGNQSAGKSSVVEAATGIAVPRDSGTCTRAPMRCTMIRSARAWSCDINLQIEYDPAGNALLSPLTIPFHKVTRPADVELWLKRAQAALLCYPKHNDTNVFRTMSADQLKEFKTDSSFSQNSIKITVMDPKGTDLSFVDLPGIIQHHTQDESLVPFIKNIVKKFAQEHNTIIVVTIPMTDDIENQEAFRIARHADKGGLRTIGVGTKPDLLGPGNTSSQERWREILEGTDSNLKLGYYCVRMPDDETRKKGLSRAELAGQEEAFFTDTAPWNSLSDRSRLGMKNFLQNTSLLLISLIERNIPRIKRRVNNLLKQEYAKLDELPPAPIVDNAIAQVTILITEFCRFLEGTISGIHNKSFIQKNRETYDTFKREICETAPQLIGNGDSGIPLGHAPCPIYVRHVTEIIKNHRTWEFPGYTHFDAVKELIRRYVVFWQTPAVDCFESVDRATTRLIEDLIKNPGFFGRYGNLQAFVREIVGNQRNLFRRETSAMLKKLFDLENSKRPKYPANENAFTSARTAWLTQYYHHNNHVNCSSEHAVMADVDAYFRVAHMRYIDNAIMAIEEEWLEKFISSLQTTLISALPAKSEERMAAMLQESKEITEKRAYLMGRIAQLTKIKDRLEEYEDAAGVTFDALDEEAVQSAGSDSESIISAGPPHTRPVTPTPQPDAVPPQDFPSDQSFVGNPFQWRSPPTPTSQPIHYKTKKKKTRGGSIIPDQNL